MYLSLILLSLIFILLFAGSANSTIHQVLLGLVFCSGLGDLFVSLNPIEIIATQYPGQILFCTYTICLYGRISDSCKIPSGLSSPPSRV